MKLFALLMIASMALFTGCNDSREVRMIKSGKIASCPDVTVGQMVDSYLFSPSWESVKSNNEKKFVNVRGDIKMANKPVHAFIQFAVDDKNGQVEFEALVFNQEPQMGLMVESFMEQLCHSARMRNKTMAGLGSARPISNP
jgi:hypothetical protein